MALRSLLFGLLALAFARPFIPNEQIPFMSDRQDESVVLLLDQSYSMQYANVFEEARSLALEQIANLQGQDELSVVAFSDQPQQLSAFENDAVTHVDVVERIAGSTNRKTDFYSAFRLAEDVLAEARHERKRLVLISDLQLNGWSGAFENWKLPHSIQVDVVPVHQEDVVNRYIEAFEQVDRRIEGRVINLFNARVMTLGADNEHPVSLQVEDGPEDASTVSSRPGSRVSFQKEAPREGVLQGQIQLSEDALPVDDIHYFTYTVEGRPLILSIDETQPERGSDRYFLERAFDQGDESQYAFRGIPAGQIGTRAIQDARILFISNTSTLSGNQLQVLLNYVEAGGTLVMSAGDRAAESGFAANLRGLGIGTVEEVIRPRTAYGYDAIIGTVDLRHPVFSVFAGSGSGAVFRPQFRQYMQVSPDSAVTVLARYDSEDPLLLERQLGEGRILAFTSTFSASWGDFPVNEMFVPFVYQLANYALSAQSEKRQYLVGDPVRLTGTPGEELDVRTPDGQLLKVTLNEQGVGFFRETEWPGHYATSGRQERFLFSVNVDPIESELAFHDVREAYGAVVPPPEDVATTVEMAKQLVVEDEERQQKGWRFVILFAVVLFTAETLLANRKRPTGSNSK